MDRGPNYATASLVVLAVLATIAALFLLKPILVPVALALLLACLLSPVTAAVRKILPVGPTGAAVVLFLVTVLLGLYVTSLTAESLVQAAHTLPGDIERLSGRMSARVNDAIRDQPFLHNVLPEPRTIDQLGDANRNLLIDKLSYGLMDLTTWVIQGFVVLVLVLFLLAESEMLAPKVVRFFAPTPGDAATAQKTLADLTHQLRAYLVTRTLINLGLGLAFALFLMVMRVNFAVALGLFVVVTNFVPYVGQVLGGALPVLITMGQNESMGDAFLVASVYLGLLAVEGYVVTPWVMGRSLDLNGTTVLITCLFWGFLWGLVGLVLAMPITVCLKLVFQAVPELNRWAELMSYQWKSPLPLSTAADVTPDEIESEEPLLPRGRTVEAPETPTSRARPSPSPVAKSPGG